MHRFVPDLRSVSSPVSGQLSYPYNVFPLHRYLLPAIHMPAASAIPLADTYAPPKMPAATHIKYRFGYENLNPYEFLLYVRSHPQFWNLHRLHLLPVCMDFPVWCGTYQADRSDKFWLPESVKCHNSVKRSLPAAVLFFPLSALQSPVLSAHWFP